MLLSFFILAVFAWMAKVFFVILHPSCRQRFCSRTKLTLFMEKSGGHLMQVFLFCWLSVVFNYESYTIIFICYTIDVGRFALKKKKKKEFLLLQMEIFIGFCVLHWCQWFLSVQKLSLPSFLVFFMSSIMS